MSNQEEQLKQESEFAKMGQSVVNNEAYKQAMTVRRTQIFEIFCNTKKEQEDVREEAWRTMQNLNALEEWLNTALTTGKMADAQLELINKQEQKH